LIQTAKRLLLRFALIAKLNQFLKYYYKVLITDQAEIRGLLNKCQFLTYDSDTNVFRVNKKELSLMEKASIRSLFKKRVRKISPASIKLKDIRSTHYYDRCLEHYIYERLIEHKRNDETCWRCHAQSYRCIGWHDPLEPFETEDKREYVKKRAAEVKIPGWGVTDLGSLVRDDDGNVFRLTSKVTEGDEGVLGLVEKIKKQHYSNWLSIASPMILGYSTTTDRYNAISGRHRLAAIKFLQRQGVMSGELDIMCHVVEYPFESLTFTRPYSDKCKQCMENDNCYDNPNEEIQIFCS
jgi:hypothetical protein